jgi:3-hydroxyisobutyrate dehydrogenase
VTSGQPSVAVLGTGIMGAPIARNIAAAGLETRAWNRTRSKAEPLAEHGVTVAATAAEAVQGADAVVTMLSDGSAVETVMTEGGALEAMRDDAVWIQMSTVGIAALERLAQLAEERGVAFVDSPVSGTKKPAEDGALTVLAAGPASARELCEPIFEAISSKQVWLDEVGEATRLKLVLNAWLVSLLADLAETIAFAEGIGVPPEQFLEAIDGGAVGAPYAQLKGPMMIKREFPTSFPLELALKDSRLVLEAAERHGVDLAVARASTSLFERALELGHGDEDMAAVFCAAQDGK